MKSLTRPLEDLLADLVTNIGLFGEAPPDTSAAAKRIIEKDLTPLQRV